MRTTLSKRHEFVIRQSLEKLLNSQYKDMVETIYLFGSCSRGTQNYNSDVDILIQHNASLDAKIARELRVELMPEDYDVPEVDLKFTCGDQWLKAEDRFSRNLRKDSELLWKK